MEKQGAMVHAREKPALEHADLPGIELFDFFNWRRAYLSYSPGAITALSNALFEAQRILEKSWILELRSQINREVRPACFYEEANRHTIKPKL